MLVKNNILINKILNNYKNHPNKVIISDKKKSLTYSQLVNLALKNSKNLLDIESEYIPILISRNVESVVAIFSVIFAGKVFCPISGLFPSERIKLFLNMLNSSFLINCSKKKVNFINCYKVSLSLEKKFNKIKIQDLAKPFYLLFTSGSTGTPKGVKLSFENILNTLLWSKNYLKWENHKIGIATQFSFDISMFDLFSGLFFNTPIYILDDPADPFQSLKEIKKNKITSIFSVPTFFSNFVRYKLIKKKFNPLKRIISGGDFFPPKDVLSWLSNQKKIDIFNVWGPTETSIVNTMYKIKENDMNSISNGNSIPVGKAHPRMEIKILKNKKEIENNKVGEICVIGKSISLGYIGNIKNSKNYFNYKSKRAYLTGDLGFIDNKGYLHIVGRKDNTIKISGFRIDTLEIENNVNFKFNATNSYLFKIKVLEIQILCLAVESLKKIKKESIIEFLKERLPSYSLPKKIIIFKKFPLNQNNKIDKQKIQNFFYEK